MLGGPVKTPKQIKREVLEKGYRGYLADDIRAADEKPEPARSHLLRELKDKAASDLARDIRQYREVARELHRFRDFFPLGSDEISCDPVHSSMSLKRNHIYNDFAHIVFLEELLSKQGDLFDF